MFRTKQPHGIGKCTAVEPGDTWNPVVSAPQLGCQIIRVEAGPEKALFDKSGKKPDIEMKE